MISLKFAPRRTLTLCVVIAVGLLLTPACDEKDATESVYYHITIDQLDDQTVSGNFSARLALVSGHVLCLYSEMHVLSNGTFSGTTAGGDWDITVELDLDGDHLVLEGCDMWCEVDEDCEIYCGLPNTTSDEAFEFRFPYAVGTYEYGALAEQDPQSFMGIHYGGGEAVDDYPDEYSNSCNNLP